MAGVSKLTTKVAAVTALALAAVSLSACSSSSSGDSSEKVSSLTLWHNSTDSPAQLQVYKNFTKKTGIKLNLVSIPSDSFETTTQTKWATGDRPDILEYHATRTLLLPFATETGKLLNGQATPDQTAANMQAAVQQAATAAGLPRW